MRRRSLLALVAFAALSSTALAQTGPSGPPSDAQARLERAAQTYAAKTWSRSAAVEGVSALALDLGPALPPAGAPRVDPRRGELTRRFARDAADAGLVVTVRLHASVDDARRDLLASLVACTATLEREPGLGDAAFVGREQTGHAPLVLALRGNVTFSARDLAPRSESPQESTGRAERAAAAVDRLVATATPLAAGATAPPAPRLLGLALEPAKDGLRRLTLDLDPASPEARFLVFTCAGDASVVDVPGGWALLAPTPGPVTVEVVACSKLLQRGSSTHTVVVPAE